MQRILCEQLAGYTILVVAQRLDTDLNSDRVGVFDAGRLLEFDAPQALLARDSSFAGLHRRSEHMAPNVAAESSPTI